MISNKSYYLDYFANFAKEAQAYNDSVLFGWIGKKRSGKSTLALAESCKIDPDFDTERIVFHLDEFKDCMKDENTQDCSVMWDEASVSAYNRDYQQEANKVLNKLMQVYGFRRVAINCTFIHLNFLDKHTRTVLDMLFKCHYRRQKGEDGARKQEMYTIPYTVVTDWIKDPKLYPYKINIDGAFQELGAIPVPQYDDLLKWGGVKKSLVNDYEKKKLEFFESIGEDPNAEDEEEPERMTKKNTLIPLIDRIHEKYHTNIKECCELVGVTEQYYYRCKAATN